MNEAEPSAKRAKTTKSSPRTLVTWNCNGFTSRCRWNSDQMQKLLQDTGYPDLLCLQEARLKAYDQHTRGKPLKSELVGVERVLESVFGDYRPVWSLADNKYAGTLTLVHRRLAFDLWSWCAFSVEGAIDLLLKRVDVSREQVGLPKATAKASPTSPSSKATKQTTMKSFFAPKKKKESGPAAMTSSGSSTGRHNEEGRFQFFSFEEIDVLQTYVPNNGTKDESFLKRRKWDQHILQFFEDRKRILDYRKMGKRPLLWCGDLNVAREYIDGTHWEQREDGNIYEWWTDEAKCFVGKKGGSEAGKLPENVGIPGFTPAERRRFAELLEKGDFVDVWRSLHPEGVASEKHSKWGKPNYTWRGHLSKTSAYNAKYQGKGQRLDYFLLSPSILLEHVNSCKILGHGEQRDGHFCGSDHCAVSMSLSPTFG